MKRFTSKTQQTGELGENIAVKFLKDKGFLILERNYTKKIGEIDIVAQKKGMIHFVEVKTLYEYGVSRENNVNPFENVTPFKMRKLSRTIAWYLAQMKVPRETMWSIDVIAVVIHRETRHAKIEVLWNVVA